MCLSLHAQLKHLSIQHRIVFRDNQPQCGGRRLETVNVIATESCRAFYQSWNDLRENGEIPHTRAFLDQHAPRLMPNAFILELTEEGPVIRFMGTALVELWGGDYTNKVFGGDLSEQATISLRANSRHVVEQPCGMVEVSEFVARSGLSFQMEAVLLPLTVDLDRPPRFCSFSQLIDPLDGHQDGVAKYKNKQKANWIDVGFGVPDTAPNHIV